MLNLCCAEVLEAGGVARKGHETALGEAERVEESQRHSHARLLLRDDRNLWSIEPEASLIILGEDACARNLLLTSTRRNGSHRKNSSGSDRGSGDFGGGSLGRGPARTTEGRRGTLGNNWCSKGWGSKERCCSGAGCQGNAPLRLSHRLLQESGKGAYGTDPG